MRTIFVNPGKRRKKRRNAPKAWGRLYQKRYHTKPSPWFIASHGLSKKKKRKHRKPKGSKTISHKKFGKLLKSRPRSNPSTVTLPLKEYRNMLTRNPRSRHRRSRRRSRRNTGITPFIQNPHRSLARRRRKNPGLSIPSLSLNTVMQRSMTYGGGAAIGTAANIFALNKISNHWLRNGARVLVGCMGAPMLGGSLGAAAAGALFAPLVTELAVALKLPVASEAMLEADLQDLLDDMDEGDESGVPMEADLW